MTSTIPVRITANCPVHIEADAASFGRVFAALAADEQVAILQAIHTAMQDHPIQWDHISIELERPENRALLTNLRSVLGQQPIETDAPEAGEVERHEDGCNLLGGKRGNLVISGLGCTCA